MAMMKITSDVIANLKSSSSSTAQNIAVEIEKANRLLETDIEMAIVRARKVLDLIMRNSCSFSGINPGTKPLEKLLDEMRRNNCLQDIVERHCRIIKDFGNIAAHGLTSSEFTEADNSLSTVEAELCFRSLNIVTKWYAEKILPYMREDFPMKVFHGDKTDFSTIKGTLSVDELVYPPEYRVNSRIISGWYQKNPNIYTLVVDKNNNRVVGYINAMPLENSYFKKIQTGTIIDVTIPPEAIRSFDFPDFYKLYISSIAIDPSYHGTTAFKLLYDGYIEKLLELARNEIFISEIIADTVTEMGEKIAKYIGMKKVKRTNHDSFIYQVTLLPPSLRLTTTKGKNLLIFYKKKYEEFKDLLDFSAQ
jgi:hypothetical protein